MMIETQRRRGGSGWRVAGTVVAVALLVLGALTAAAWLARHTQVQDQVYRRPVRQIVLNGSTGHVTVLPGAAGEVTVHRHLTWSWTKPKIQEVWSGDALRISTGCPFISVGPSCGVDYTLHVPADAVLSLHTSTGDITVSGMNGALTLSASTGNVTVRDARDDLTASTSTGDITATGLTGRSATAHASTGNIRLGFASTPTSVQARASTGDVTVTVPAGGRYRVQAHANTGDVHTGVDEDSQSGNSITANTSTGNIRISYG